MAMRCQACVSAGVVDEAQQRDEIADVLALEKLHAAGDVVGDAGAGERELHLEREEMRAVEDGDLVGGDAVVVDEGVDALEDELGLLAVVHRLRRRRASAQWARAARSSLSKWRPLGWAMQDAVGEVEDLRRRAVVGLDAVDDRARMPVGKRHDVLEVGAAPRVDALGVVADGHHAMVRGEPVDDLRLDGVGVLVLVDEHVAETAARNTRRPRARR